MGASNDGDPGLYSSKCLPSDNYVMNPLIGNHSTNLLHTFEFSSCSINSIKNLTLNQNFSNVSSQASCLIKKQSTVTYSIDNFAGQSFTADDQCKMIYGSEATFCHVYYKINL